MKRALLSAYSLLVAAAVVGMLYLVGAEMLGRLFGAAGHAAQTPMGRLLVHFGRTGTLGEPDSEPARFVREGRVHIAGVPLGRFARDRRAFHPVGAPVDHAWERSTPCNVCHSHLAHGEEEGKQFEGAVLNMHSGVIVCRGCHGDAGGRAGFRWIDAAGGRADAPWPGTTTRPDGALDFSGYGRAKLAPADWPGPDVEGVAQALAFVATSDGLDDEARKAGRAPFHDPLGERVLQCQDCHAPVDRGGLDFEGLGFSRQRASALTEAAFVPLVSGEREVYLPGDDFLGGGGTPAAPAGP